MAITRREFVRNSALVAGGFKLVPLLHGTPDNANSPLEETATLLEKLFVSPANAAWPWTYWYGANGNITREGITADLESMKRVGIRGVLYMEVDLYFPAGPIRSLTPEWRALMQHAMREAERLGLAWNMNNDGGWCGSGGPWITPELSMQVVVWSETVVEGPAKLRTTLAQPQAIHGYYRDIAVLAFPTPAADNPRMVECSPRFTYGADRKEIINSSLTDGNPGTIVRLPRPPGTQPLLLNIDFPEPFTAQSVSIALEQWNSGMRSVNGSLQVSDDGEHYRVVRKMNIYWPHSSVTFPKVSSRHFRVLIYPMASDWSMWDSREGVPVGEVELHAGPRIEDIPGKAVYLRQGAYSTKHDVLSSESEFSADAVIPVAKIVDISNKVDANGRLQWDAPSGRWTVLRFGHTSSGSNNEPAPKELTGLECDKLSKKAADIQFDGYVAKVLDVQAEVGASVVTMAHIDSWEVGGQNWTLGFDEQFRTRRGYNPIPYLPVLTGRAVENVEHSERFLWDLRRTVADLLLENYAEHLREICHRHGLTLSIEAYGSGPLDELAYGGRADVPIGEFWLGDTLPSQIFNVCNKAMASSAHVYGHPIVGAEAFTANAPYAMWNDHPFQLKPLGDLAFTWGINWFVLSQFMMQPWKNRKPGLTLGPWGSHLDRGNTWWEYSRPWMTYLARCQTLLQSGSFVADVAYLGSEGVPYSAPWRGSLDPALPPGYDYDVLPPEVLLKDATVAEGRLILTSGMSYRLLVLQPGQAMTPQLLKTIKNLVNDGLTVTGARPVHSPSLSGFPQCDAEVHQLAEELWGECDGDATKESRLGKGRIFYGHALSDTLINLGIPPDFACHAAAVGEEIRFIHRRVQDDDYYFVASGVAQSRTFLCTFRVDGKRKRAELWWPDSGRIEPITIFNESAIHLGAAPGEGLGIGMVTIPIRLDPYGSAFVVFRAAGEEQVDHIVSVQHDGAAAYGLTPILQYNFHPGEVKQEKGGRLAIETAKEGKYKVVTAAGHSLEAEVRRLPSPVSIRGPWELEFPKNLGAPDHVAFDRLISWTDHPNPGVKYFSGTATYRNQFVLQPEMLRSDLRVWLDLGRVAVIAEVVLNGKDLGILWKPPFTTEITEFAVSGKNNIEIRVVNLWPNRLIGDEQLPEDCEWATPSTPRDPFARSMGFVLDRWPKWLLENKPRQSGRVAFSAWKHWGKDDPLLESGLLGPVRIFAKARAWLTNTAMTDAKG